MAIEQNYCDLPHTIVKALWSADVLTGEFLKPLPAQSLATLRRMGLALIDQPVLSPRGCAVRRCLTWGSPVAIENLAALLKDAGSARDEKESNDFSDGPRLTGPEMAFAGSTRSGAGHRHEIR